MIKTSGLELAGIAAAVVIVGILFLLPGLIYPLLIVAGFAVLLLYLLTVAKVDYDGEEESLCNSGSSRKEKNVEDEEKVPEDQ